MRPSKFLSSLFLTLIFTVTLFAIVHAATITVDGNDDPWPAGSLAFSDPDDQSTSRDGLDILDVYYTNNSTTLFWRVDTQANSAWGTNPGLGRIDICLETDGNGANNGTGLCDGSFGYDFVLRMDSASTAQLLDSSGTQIGTATVSAANSGGTINEMSVAVSDLGFTSCTSGSPCNFTYQISSFNNFGSGSYLDHTASTSGQLPQSPTAVSLRGIQGNVATSNGGIWLALIAVGVFTAVFLFLTHRARTTA